MHTTAVTLAPIFLKSASKTPIMPYCLCPHPVVSTDFFAVSVMVRKRQSESYSVQESLFSHPTRPIIGLHASPPLSQPATHDVGPIVAATAAFATAAAAPTAGWIFGHLYDIYKYIYIHHVGVP